MLTYIVTRKRGADPEVVIGEGSRKKVLALVADDMGYHIEESERPCCPSFTYRIAVVVATGTAIATADGKRTVTVRA